MQGVDFSCIEVNMPREGRYSLLTTKFLPLVLLLIFNPVLGLWLSPLVSWLLMVGSDNSSSWHHLIRPGGRTVDHRRPVPRAMFRFHAWFWSVLCLYSPWSAFWSCPGFKRGVGRGWKAVDVGRWDVSRVTGEGSLRAGVAPPLILMA